MRRRESEKVQNNRQNYAKSAPWWLEKAGKGIKARMANATT
jgi:hypothetical protein